MTDRVVGPEVEVEFVAGRDVAGRSVVSTDPAHQRSVWLSALPDLQHVVLTAGVSLQLKVEKLYLDPAMINNLSNFHKSYCAKTLIMLKKSLVEICTENFNVNDELVPK